MHQPLPPQSGHPHHRPLHGLQFQHPHLLPGTVGDDIHISYYLRILDYLHEFVIEEADFQKVWMELGGF